MCTFKKTIFERAIFKYFLHVALKTSIVVVMIFLLTQYLHNYMYNEQFHTIPPVDSIVVLSFVACSFRCVHLSAILATVGETGSPGVCFDANWCSR